MYYILFCTKSILGFMFSVVRYNIFYHLFSCACSDSNTMLSVPAEAAVQAKRERFKLERIRAMEVAVLQSTTVFVERYLREVTVWSFDDKDQNSLTLEVSCMPLSLNMMLTVIIFIACKLSTYRE